MSSIEEILSPLTKEQRKYAITLALPAIIFKLNSFVERNEISQDEVYKQIINLIKTLKE